MSIRKLSLNRITVAMLNGDYRRGNEINMKCEHEINMLEPRFESYRHVDDCPTSQSLNSKAMKHLSNIPISLPYNYLAFR